MMTIPIERCPIIAMQGQTISIIDWLVETRCDDIPDRNTSSTVDLIAWCVHNAVDFRYHLPLNRDP
jgi:hypothetical protein